MHYHVSHLDCIPRSSPPFAPSFAQEDEGPWLSKAEQKKVLDMMPKGVPVGANLKFYKLPFRLSENVHDEQWHLEIHRHHAARRGRSLAVSGGMHLVDRKEWRNVTGLDLPGKITVYQEDTDVRAFSLVPKWRWHFPTGTLAYDVLLRIKDGKEHIFEVRVQEKSGQFLGRRHDLSARGLDRQCRAQ